MPPSPDFFTQDASNLKEIYAKWQPAELKYRKYFAAVLTTASGQSLFSSVEIDKNFLGLGRIIVPVNISNSSELLQTSEWSLFKNNLALFGPANKSLRQYLNHLGIESGGGIAVIGKFLCNYSQGRDTSLIFGRYPLPEETFMPRGGLAHMQKALSVEGLTQDFMESFPGYNIGPLPVNR